MKKLFFLFSFLFLMSGMASATTLQAISPSGKTEVTIYEEPCSTPAIASILNKYFEKSYNAKVVHEGVTLKACWVPLVEDGAVGVMDETGDGGTIPIDQFKELPSI